MSGKKVLYAHCGMRRKNTRKVSWIPEKFAVLGKVVKLKEDGEWSDGWVIESVGHIGEFPAHIEKTIREHRKHTGDSLPKMR